MLSSPPSPSHITIVAIARKAKKSTAPKSPRKRAAPARGGTAMQRARDASSSLRGEFVYGVVRDDISSGRLRPGDRLRETEIADRMGVSRTPVREALKRLESDGLVSFGQPRGLTVTELTHGQILDLYAMREVLEGAAARFAAERASPLEIATLKQILEQHKSATAPAEVAAANRQLHHAIVSAAHNIFLQRVMNVLSDALALLGTTTYSVPGRIASGWKENAEIVDCIARGDADAAEKAAQAHIRAAGAIRIGMTRARR
jgi:DNA-binding GntR family transcriptional regulator